MSNTKGTVERGIEWGSRRADGAGVALGLDREEARRADDDVIDHWCGVVRERLAAGSDPHLQQRLLAVFAAMRDR